MESNLKFDYYYGIESEQYSFFRIPKILMRDARFKRLSCEAKLLYGLMLDRMSLSIKNGWYDDEDRVFIYYTLDNVMEDLNCGREKCAKIFSELDSKRGIGLIEKKRQGLGKPDIIYVKNFTTVSTKNSDVQGGEHKEITLQCAEVRKSNFKKFDNRTSGDSISENDEVREPNANKTEINKPINIIYPSMMEERVNEFEIWEKEIKKKMEYDTLAKEYTGWDKDILDELIMHMVDIFCVEREKVCIGKEKYPVDLVRKRFSQVDYFVMRYVMESLKRAKTKRNNVYGYLLKTLYNAPGTINSYYQAR